MIVLHLNACPSDIRGDVSKWLMEIAAGIYVGQLSHRVREALWNRICKLSGEGSAIMVCSARNEQGFVYYVHNTDWTPVDFDGITLMRRPLPNRHGNSSEQKKADSFEQVTVATPKSVSGMNCSAISTGQYNTASETFKTVPKQMNEDEQSAILPKGKDVSPSKPRKSWKAQAPLPYVSWPEGKPLPTSFTVLDMETTGLNPEKDQIIEIACVRVRDGAVTAVEQCLVQCAIPLPETIRDLTGLTDELLTQDGIPLSQAITRLLSFLGEDWIVGHNVAFDICFLLAACTRLGNEPPGMHAIDTVVLSRKALSDMVANYRLETVARFLNLAERQSHRALPDAQLTAQLYIKLNEISVPVN